MNTLKQGTIMVPKKGKTQSNYYKLDHLKKVELCNNVTPNTWTNVKIIEGHTYNKERCVHKYETDTIHINLTAFEPLVKQKSFAIWF